MPLTAIYANVACRDLESSARWYGTLFGRDPDAAPMDGLVEWHHGEAAGFQLHRNPEKAGRGTLTLIVSDIASERERVAALGPGEVEAADYVSIVRMQDPDGNLVVLAGS